MPLSVKKTLSTLIPILAIGSFLAFIGPYNTQAFGTPGVWFYWTGLIALGWGAGALAGLFFDRVKPPWPMWSIYMAVSLMVSVPVTSAVVLIQALIWGPFAWPYIPGVFLSVWVISAAVTAISYLRDARTQSVGNTTSVGSTLIEKLPHRLRKSEIIALVSEDHYLRVHTRDGDALILMRLSDAIAAVEALEGAQTHRSWWVARQAVEGVERGNGRATLSLPGGLEAPVSRTFAPKLREAGWY
ncbi:MAG: LytTR family transcriptional regulator [Alphaproteobacteria bacterium]|nr:LytTR family transcriptional regulator [Alphaproteobacteria bacterium]